MRGAVRQPCVLVKYGEIAIKGRNKGRFERQLVDNLRSSLDGIGGPYRLRRRGGVLAVSAPNHHDELIERARQLIGVSVVQPALRVEKTPDAAASAAVELARIKAPADGTPSFAVRPRRRHKGFPMNSQELAVFVGARVQQELGWPVDLRHPDVEIAVEVDENEVFVSTDRYPGQGGLPVGTSGRVLVLLSGGFDSPVAAYRAMRRGLRCEFIHFTGAPLTGPSSAYKAYALVRQLERFQGGSQLHLVKIGEAQRALAAAGAGELQVVAQRRLMVQVADRLADKLGAQALVTGDSLGQVSSQTLANMAAVEQAAELPVLRPLVGWDKEEIIDEAKRIDTAEISQLPDEDCCTLLIPPYVTTHAKLEKLARVENRLGIEEVVDRVLGDVQVLQPDGSLAEESPDAGDLRPV